MGSWSFEPIGGIDECEAEVTRKARLRFKLPALRRSTA